MSDVTCRGSFALGTACGKCSRCRREIESYNAMKAVRDKLNTPSSSLSRIEELEAKLAKAVEIAEWYDDMMDKHVTETGSPARISDEEGVWHDGPAADMAQKILRGLQKILTELKGQSGFTCAKEQKMILFAHEAPERIALKWTEGAAITSGPLMDHPEYTHYVRADRIEELEAKLAKAVEHFKKLRRRQDCLETFDLVVHEITETALAELTGGKDE